MLYVRLGLAVVASAVVAVLLWTTFNRPATPASCVSNLTLINALQNAGSVELVFEVGALSLLKLQIDNEETDASIPRNILASPGDGPAELDPTFAGQVFSLCQSEEGTFRLMQSN